MRSFVFVTQLPSRYEDGSWVPSVDVSPAKDFGELVFIIPPGFNHPSIETALPQLLAKLEEFTEHDYLLPMGDPLLMSAASAILGSRFQAFKMLKWDRLTRKYNPFNIVTSIHHADPTAL